MKITTARPISPYEVTGVTVNGQRFKAMRFKTLTQARCINLYRGTVWERQSDGTRRVLWQVWN